MSLEELFEQEAETPAEGAPSQEALNTVSALARKQLELEDQIEQLERELKERKRDLAKVQELDLPTAMDQLGFASFRMTDGREIVVEEGVHASIAKKNQAAAYAWLREHGHAEIIKNEIKLAFGRGEEERAQELLQELAGKYSGVQHAESVHASTLKAFVREMVASGEDIPEDLFGIYHSRKAIIKTK